MNLKRFEVLAVALLFLLTGPLYAIEHGGREHAGKEHGEMEDAGTKMAEPSAKDIRDTMQKYVEEQSVKTGAFEIYDPETTNIRKLKLVKVHERVGKTGNYYYSCADFQDIESGQKLDLDLDVENADGKLRVAYVRIHKVNGKELYTYDKNDNRIPVIK